MTNLIIMGLLGVVLGFVFGNWFAHRKLAGLQKVASQAMGAAEQAAKKL